MLSIGTKLYFITHIGSPASSSPFTIGINVFDTATSTWSVKVGQFQGASEYQDTTAAVLNGKLYFVGGKPYVVAFAQARLIEYDPNANTWTAKADLPLAVGRAGVSAVNGKLYAIGGYSGMSTVQNTTQIWDPASNTWSPGAALPTPRYGLGVAALGSDIYAIDGFNGTVGLSTVEKLSGTICYRIKNRWQGTYMHTEHLTGFVDRDECASAGDCSPPYWL